jgi:hypothetical protein
MIARERASQFWRWFSSNAERLCSEGSAEAAEAILDEVSKVEERLSVEVSTETHDCELIISANRDPGLFGRVEELVAMAPNIPGWTVVALKPARGFEFSLSFGGASLDASSLYFQPLQSERAPGELGLRLLAPPVLAEAVLESAWLLIEIGIGERATADVAHIEVAAMSNCDDGLVPISDLGAYLERRKRQREKAEQ